MREESKRKKEKKTEKGEYKKRFIILSLFFH